ncbi:MAG TPA: prepilin-type N-terminal cleavage/methylation domain-containing protein [Verrucomicrobiae bacterium]|nr:prepilin-type N-terminal cleavage/methylation domain-containing protein [Verrucomicrobiae bacterium]
MKSKSQHCRAFTLIEIMLALTIFSLVLVLIYSTWTMILRSTKVAQIAAAEVQRQRMAVRTIEDALMCIQSSQSSLQYYNFLVQNGDAPMLSFVARLPDDFPRNGRFGDFNVRRLTFTVEAGADSGNDLVLRQNPILMDMDEDEQNVPLVLAHNVKGFTVECWDTNALAWSDEWDDTNSIPPLIRVTLALGGKDNSTGHSTPELIVSRMVNIPSVILPTVIQNGTPGGGGGGGSGFNNNRGNGNGNNNRNNPNQPNQPNPFNRGFQRPGGM